MKKIIFIILSVVIVFNLPVHATKRYGTNFCNQPDFDCITVKKGQTWEKLFPDPYQRQVVRRLNRMNTRLWAGLVIAVPKNLSTVDLMNLSPFPRNIQAPGEKLIVVDPNSLAFGAYDPDGYLVHWGPISGGQIFCGDVGKKCRTVSGKYRVYHKDGAQCESKIFPIGRGGAPMPYCMYFHGGFALHGSQEVPGYHASHGCVRIFQEDAQWLNEKFVDLPSDGQVGTQVIINSYM